MPGGAVDRVRQLRRLLATEGSDGVGRRLRTRAAAALVPPGTAPLLVTSEEIDAAEEVLAGMRPAPAAMARQSGEPLHVAWVSSPPGPGSGGHTTMLRLVRALEDAGHRCTLYLRDQHGWSVRQHEEIVREHWPDVRAEVRHLADGIADAHVIVATGWETAYAVLGSPARGVRCYLVQDLENLFYPAGSSAMLAEATYRFGLHGITAGPWLAERLRADHGMSADHFDFGCDLDTYRGPMSAVTTPSRSGVAYYCRPGTPRRGHELAVLALTRFARECPDVPIHCYGSTVRDLPFAAQQHGRLSPAELGELYRRCTAGLVLSATNVSLVPWEMLAAGCLPVVNEAEHNRAVLDNEHVRYTVASPGAIARSLVELVRSPQDVQRERAVAAASSVRSVSWAEAGRTVVTLLEGLVPEPDASCLLPPLDASASRDLTMHGKAT
ncbi:rhamnosyltransferase WsaF family glycosyltransferase [Nocardioides ochotonae]|uniref:rhamnosyltransferase WsaF family glycosyltransferase n=1 Tax=Nocardioides ochotonae TaxID=2685869 RepID=UPI0037C8AAA8